MINTMELNNRSIAIYLREIRKYPLLTPEEEYHLAKRYKEKKDMTAAHKLITSNLRFVVKIALEYIHYNVRLSDLIQEGNLGLIKALTKFDPDKGYRFISYAIWWIRAYIQAFILKTKSLVKIGTTQAQRKLFYSLNKAKREILRLSGKDFDEHIDENEKKLISEKLGVRVKDVQEMEKRLENSDISFDSTISENDDRTLLDKISSDELNMDERIIKEEEATIVRTKLTEFLKKANEKERYIAYNRLMSDNPKTLEEIGEVFGITRERVRQIEERLKEKLRKELSDLAPTAV
ncbi:MAG: RNA polymerase factor sigma-32 [Deltaproteobacteria bacterium]|nr:RNA polymerase factor sigma-32 [Deltaproteobacteria bacterium]